MFNCPKFVEEFTKFIKGLAVKSALEVGALSGELMDAVGADGVDIDPQREDVIKADIRKITSLPQFRRKRFELVFSSGLIEHYPPEEAVDVLKAMAKVSGKYVLTYVSNSECKAYKNAKAKTTEPWKDELDYTEIELAKLHEEAGLTVVDVGTAGAEWAKRFGSEPSEPYLVYVLAQK